MKEMGTSDPDNGQANNPSESMNAVLHNLQYWKHVPLVICFLPFHLSVIINDRGQHLYGSWNLKEEFSYLQHDSSLNSISTKGY